jgi:hypothetical protein
MRSQYDLVRKIWATPLAELSLHYEFDQNNYWKVAVVLNYQTINLVDLCINTGHFQLLTCHFI